MPICKLGKKSVCRRNFTFNHASHVRRNGSCEPGAEGTPLDDDQLLRRSIPSVSHLCDDQPLSSAKATMSRIMISKRLPQFGHQAYVQGMSKRECAHDPSAGAGGDMV